MHTSNAATHVETKRSVSRDDMLALAKICDTQDDVISFYFSLASTPDTSHREEVVMVKDLVRDASRGERKTPGLATDMESLLATAEEIRNTPSRLRAVFACRDQNIWKEFDLPADGSVRYLKVGKRFHIAPLLRALQACVPYCVTMIEHGQARAFVVHGTDIQEALGRFATRDLALHADDSRVGWSHHIAANLEEHAKAYLKGLVPEIHNFMRENDSSLLVIGCREDLWGEIEPQLRGQQWAGEVIGHFDPASFEVSSFDVLQATRPIFEQYQRRHYFEVLDKVYSATQHAVGFDEVGQLLEQGRVHKLLLGKPSDDVILECQRCAHLQAVVDHCQYCGSQAMFVGPWEEALIRKALLTGVEIIAPGMQTSYGIDGAAALLRF
jgi:peptide subunit release factor 1 (eRF1)